MIRGFVKCSLCLFFALLKPIIEIPKIISLPTLFEIIKVITETAVILRLLVNVGIVSLFGFISSRCM